MAPMKRKPRTVGEVATDLALLRYKIECWCPDIEHPHGHQRLDGCPRSTFDSLRAELRAMKPKGRQ